MTSQELRNVGLTLYGYGWQTKLAKLLGVNNRTVNRWATDKTPVPKRVEMALQAVRVESIPTPEWIVGKDPQMREDYVLHLKAPRFQARIAASDELMSGYALVITDGSKLGCLEWLDLPLPREQEARWLAEAARVVLEFETRK